MKQIIPPKTLFISFLLSLVFPLLIFLLFSPLIDQVVVTESEHEAFRVADYLVTHFGFTEQNLSHWNRANSQEVSAVSQSFGLYETSIISADGRIVYSSRHNNHGKRIQGTAVQSLIGKNVRSCTIKHRGELSLNGVPLNASVVETYVPMLNQGQVIGGVAVLYDFSRLYSGIGRLKVYFALLLFVISFGCMLLIYFYHAKIERGKQLQSIVEEALEQEQLKAETVFSSMGDDIIIQDREYRIIYQNSINREAYGDQRGKHCYHIFEGRDHPCHGCPVELTYQDGAIHKVEKEMATTKGMMHFELTASPLRSPAGEIVAGIKVVRDITEKRRIEEQLRHAQKMEAIGSLASGISHEFNNILTSINGFSEMLMDIVPRGTDEHRYLEAIYRSGKRAETVTSGLLAYSRKQISNRGEVALNDMIKDLGQVFSIVIGPNIAVRIEPAAEKLTVMADRSQLEQVLINIITNARDAMPGGGELLIRTRGVRADESFVQRHDSGTPGAHYAAITIRDSGLGMDKVTMEQIFEPFFTTKDVGHGTGLGLSIVYGIVRQHGGFMDVTSAPGKGAEFSIFLPAQTSNDSDTPARHTAQSFQQSNQFGNT